MCACIRHRAANFALDLTDCGFQFLRSRGIGRKLSIAQEGDTDCRTGARWGTRGQNRRTMCGILALVSLGATIDCLLGAEGGRGQGGEGKHARRADSMPEEVRKLFPVLRCARPRKRPQMPSLTHAHARARMRTRGTHAHVRIPAYTGRQPTPASPSSLLPATLPTIADAPSVRAGLTYVVTYLQCPSLCIAGGQMLWTPTCGGMGRVTQLRGHGSVGGALIVEMGEGCMGEWGCWAVCSTFGGR